MSRPCFLSFFLPFSPVREVMSSSAGHCTRSDYPRVENACRRTDLWRHFLFFFFARSHLKAALSLCGGISQLRSATTRSYFALLFLWRRSASVYINIDELPA
uniref:Uncharacterized protein n=1 Tax=Amblyomma americanum TaxID=6943 RepID=A0A0C9SEM8_AMBAM